MDHINRVNSNKWLLLGNWPIRTGILESHVCALQKSISFYLCMYRLREREERGKRRAEDLHTIAKLQDKLTERDQLIKSLVVRHAHSHIWKTCLCCFSFSHLFVYPLQEDLHQISQHPPLSSDEILRPYDSRTQAGTLSPTLKVAHIHTSPIKPASYYRNRSCCPTVNKRICKNANVSLHKVSGKTWIIDCFCNTVPLAKNLLCHC